MVQNFSQMIKIFIWPFLFVGVNLYGFFMFLRSLFPHRQINKGDKFLCLDDYEQVGLVHYKGPFTDGFRCTVPKGTVLVAFSNSERISLGFGCVPENEKEFEILHVPEDLRNDEKYTGYSFGFKYKEIGKKLKTIRTGEN